MRENAPEFVENLEETQELTDEDEEKLAELIDNFKSEWRLQHSWD